jgi:SAM-dependent methyltransferase
VKEKLERSAWIKERRRINEERMDTLFAPIYDDHWGAAIDATHKKMVSHFLALCPSQARVLDAACGTGKYWSLLLEAGCTVLGIDQSTAMLRRAAEKFPRVPVERLGVQELRLKSELDGIICIDAMENVFPEDWPVVLSNFYRSLRPAGLLYLTVELPANDLYEVFDAAVRAGLPVVEREYVKEGGYHFYPSIEVVRSWLDSACFGPIEEAVGDGYRHHLLRRA